MEKEYIEKTNWISHVEWVVVLLTIIGGFIWMDSKFEKVNERLSIVERDLSIIKAVLIMKNIMPNELAKHEEQKKVE